MKKSILLILCLVLMLAGCGRQEEAPSENWVTVNTVDELVAAIGPDREIHLGEGAFDLSTASTYGQRSGNPYVKWVDCYDGWQLSIHDLDNLTIIGAGIGKTNLVAQSINANVLDIGDCSGVRLEGFTAGHREQAEACNGSVISFDRCENVEARELGLYGCGAVGIQAYRTNGLNAARCQVYECSNMGFNFYQGQELSVTDCHIHDIGGAAEGYLQGYTVFAMDYCQDVTVSGCTLEGNSTNYFLLSSESQGIHLTNNRITDSSFYAGVMRLWKADVVLETGNVFENNQFSRWYEWSLDGEGMNHARDEKGQEVYVDDPPALHRSSEPVESVPVIAGEQKRVEVSTVDEFLAAIDSNTEIVLTAPLLDLSTASDYGGGAVEHYFWVDNYDGPQLVIEGVENLSIVSESREEHTISAVPRYANVLAFQDCTNLMVKGITAGHTQEPGSCMGGVLEFDNCSNVLVEDCNLYGCGILGVNANYCGNMQIVNSNIYECSYGGIQCGEVNGLTIGGCDFWDLGGPTFSINGCTDVSIDGQNVLGYYLGD